MLVESAPAIISLDNIQDLSAELSIRPVTGQGLHLRLRILNPAVNELERIFKIWHKRSPVTLAAGMPRQKDIEIKQVVLINKQFSGTDLILEAAAEHIVHS